MKGSLAFLGDVVDLLTGNPFESENYAAASSGIRLLRGDNVIQGTVRWEDARLWPIDRCDGLERYQLKLGDVVLAMDRTWVNAGLKCARVRIYDLPSLLVQRVARIRGKSGTETGYIAQVLKSHRFAQHVKGTQTESAVPHISTQQIKEFSFWLPRLIEQQKIADILGTWDEALEKLDALIAAKGRRKQALMQQLLTGKSRLRGFGKRWDHAKLGDLFKERTESNRLDLTLLSITADRGVVRRDSLEKRDTSSEDKSKYLRISPGDIGYNTMRMWQGVSALSTLEGIVSPAYTICMPTNRMVGQFAAHFFKFPHTISLFHRYSQGMVDDTLNLKFPSFAAIEVTVPRDIAEQRAIATILDTADAELRLLRQQRTALDQQKRGLMQKLLTGQIRVPLS
jgi:type I restriction enzyme S subunit